MNLNCLKHEMPVQAYESHPCRQHQELINLKRRKLRFQGIKQRPHLRRVQHHTVNQRGPLVILKFIGPGRVPLRSQLGGKLEVAHRALQTPEALRINTLKNPPRQPYRAFSRRVDASLLEKNPPLLPLNLESSGSSG